MTSISIGTSGGLLALSALTPATIAGVATLLGIGAFLHGSHHQNASYDHKYPDAFSLIKGAHGHQMKHSVKKQPHKAIDASHGYKNSNGLETPKIYSPKTKGKNSASASQGHHFQGSRQRETSGKNNEQNGVPVYTSKYSSAVSGGTQQHAHEDLSGFGAPKKETIHGHGGGGKKQENQSYRNTGRASLQPQIKASNDKMNSHETHNDRVRKEAENLHLDGQLRSHFREFPLFRPRGSRRVKSSEPRSLDSRDTEARATAMLAAALRSDQSDCAKRLVCELSATPNQSTASEHDALLRLIRKTRHSPAIETNGSKNHFGRALDIGISAPKSCHIHYSKCPISDNVTVIQAFELMKP